MHTLRKQFQKELKNLHKMLLEINTAVKTNIDTMILAIKTNNHELANQVIKGDDFIDELEVKIESFCVDILISQQPVATDLREVTAALKMTTDIERISDYCSSVCEHFIKIQNIPNFQCIDKIINLSKNAKLMFNDMIESFLNQNNQTLINIIAKDSISDSIYNDLEEFITTHLKEIGIKNSINFILIGRALERMADHITNVCHWILFKITGKFKIKVN